jgi:hypothetical protein
MRFARGRMTAGFAFAYAGGAVAQAGLVASAGAGSVPFSVRGLRNRLFALVPLASLVGVAFGLRVWPGGALVLTHVALVLVPLLAGIAAARVGPVALAAVGALLVAALLGHHGPAGQVGAFGLIVVSCLPLGSLLADLTPTRWLAAGIVAMALADLAFVASGLLAPANTALNEAAVTAHLPQLQRVELGTLTMGYGDLFLPALVGALLAARARRRRWVAGLTLGFGLAAGLLFLVADTLPATVPVALALVVVEVGEALGGARSRSRMDAASQAVGGRTRPS